MENQIPWIEKYRPSQLDDLISHQEIIKTLNKFIENDSLPNLLFYGPPGTGKTSTIKALTKKMFGDKNYRQNVLELNASDERGIAVVRDNIKTFASMNNINLFAGAPKSQIKLIILDEADEMTNDAQFALRRIIEKYAKTCRFCMICNHVSKIIPALQSRCTRFKFKAIDLASATKRTRHICEQESLQIDETGLETVYNLSQGDMRKIVNMLQSLKLQNDDNRKISQDVVYRMTGNIRPDQIKQIMQILREYDIQEGYKQLIQKLRWEGISLSSLIKEVGKYVDSEYKGSQLGYLYKQIADIEYRLSIDCSDQVQIGAFMAVFVKVRQMN